MNASNRRRSDRIEKLTPIDVDQFTVPYWMRVMALAKVVRQMQRYYKIILLCLTIIASSLFGLGLLAVTVGTPLFVRKTLIRLLDEWRVKDPSFMPEVLPPFDLPSFPDYNPGSGKSKVGSGRN